MATAMQGDRDRSQIVQTLIHLRKARSEAFPHELFDEFGWTILLELFAAHALNETVSVAVITERAGTSEAVVRRWIDHLVTAGQIEPTEGLNDVRMTATSIAAMRTYVDRVKAMGVEQFRTLR